MVNDPIKDSAKTIRIINRMNVIIADNKKSVKITSKHGHAINTIKIEQSRYEQFGKVFFFDKFL